MATQNYSIQRFGPQDEGEVIVRYDDATSPMRVNGVRIVNPTTQTVRVTAIRPSDRQPHAGTFGPGSDTTLNVPTNPSGRINITIDPTTGRLDGVEVQCQFPWNG